MKSLRLGLSAAPLALLAAMPASAGSVQTYSIIVPEMSATGAIAGIAAIAASTAVIWERRRRNRRND